MRRVLITGAAGFVGRHFTRHFLEAGDEVHAVDSLAPLTGAINPAAGWPVFEPRDYPGFHFHQEDCRDFFRRMREAEFDYTLHLAALVGGRAMIENDPLAVADDLSIDAAYWQWAKLAKPCKTVCFSSSAAYPVKFQQQSSYRLLTEDMIDFGRDLGVPDMSYGWAKLTCEYLARLAYQRHGLRSVCYRPFSGYGEDQDDSYPFPAICRRVLANRGAPVIRVWGSGRQMRDFIHIDDCVQGVIATMDKINDGDALNLSTGALTSFVELVTAAAELCGYSPQIEGIADKPSGVHARGGDTQKQTSLGFAPAITLEAGLRRTLRRYELGGVRGRTENCLGLNVPTR